MTKALVVVLDGFRPADLDPDLLPNLAGLLGEGTSWSRARSVFPSMTRVCVASLVTGHPPGRHGIVHNQIPDRGRGTIDTADKAQLVALDAAEGLLAVPSLGEILAGAGRRMAVVATSSAGCGHLINHRAGALWRLGHRTLSAHGAAASSSPEAFAAAVDRHGAPPPAARPNLARLDWATDALLADVLHHETADLAVLWLNEPDTSYHDCGLDSDGTRAALARVDACLGRILAWWRAADHRERWVLAVLSDHGHVQAREPIDLPAAFAAAGLTTARDLGGEAGLALVPGGTSGHVRLREPSPARLAELAAWLVTQPWCGHLLVPDALLPTVAGALPLGVVALDHPRAADLHFTLAPAPDRRGAWFSGGVPVGGGLHGGLHPDELATLLVLAGPGITPGLRTGLPAGLPDLAPTLLTLLGLEGAEAMGGRVLDEALAGRPAPPAPVLEEHVGTTGAYRQAIRTARVGKARYVLEGAVG